MAESNNSKLTTEERVFLIKTFYKTDNKSETCRRFQEKFGRAVKRDTIANLSLGCVKEFSVCQKAENERSTRGNDNEFLHRN